MFRRSSDDLPFRAPHPARPEAGPWERRRERIAPRLLRAATRHPRAGRPIGTSLRAERDGSCRGRRSTGLEPHLDYPIRKAGPVLGLSVAAGQIAYVLNQIGLDLRQLLGSSHLSAV